MADDLFRWLDALYTKAQPEGTPPTWMMHRFLASERDYAEAARVFGKEIREPDLVFRAWQGLLPKGGGAPRLGYVAPKKPPAEEDLVRRMMQVLGVRRGVCERMVELVRLGGRLPELYLHYGCIAPEEGQT